MMFENPYFLLLLPAAAAVFFFAYSKKGGGSAVRSAAADSSVGTSAPVIVKFKRKSFAARFIDLLLLPVILLASFSLAGPYLPERKVQYLVPGNEYLIILDVSPSMAAGEGKTTRLEAAKEAARNIAETSGNDYPGLVLFASNAVTALYPTPDRGEFLKRLDAAAIMELGDATDMGSAMGTALHYIKDSASAEKRVFLISDGGSNYGQLPPLDAAMIAAELGIRINCVAVGSSSASGREVVIETYGKEAEVRTVSAGYEPQVLEKIADITGGYFLENPSYRSIAGISSSGNRQAEKSETVHLKNDLTRFFLYVSVFVFIGAMGLKIFILKELIP